MLNYSGDIRKKPVFFILSRPRSGSTMLRMMLDAHPQIAIPPECSYIIDLYSRYGKIKRWDSQRKINFLADLKKNQKIDGWFVDFPELKERLLIDKELDSYAELCKLTHLNYKTPYLKSAVEIIGDKNPIYSIYARTLLKIFPNAKFIHLTRDYRANILSLKNTEFEAPVTSLLAWRWKKVNRDIFRLAQMHRDQFFYLKYEDLVRSPVENLKRLCDFLAVDYNTEMLNYTDKKEEFYKLYKNYNIDKYFGNLFSSLDPSVLERWKDEMDQHSVSVAENIAGEVGMQAGYEKTHPQAKFKFSLSAMMFSMYGALWYQMKYVFDGLPLGIKNFLYAPNLFARIFRVFKKKP